MKKTSYSGYRFPPEIIQQAIWLYLRFTFSLRDVEDLLAERGVAVSYETVRRWVNYFGPMIAADLRKRRLKPHTTIGPGFLQYASNLTAAFSASSMWQIDVAKPSGRRPSISSKASSGPVATIR